MLSSVPLLWSVSSAMTPSHPHPRTSLISELAYEMEGAGKGNKSLYTRENCQGMCDKMCSLEGKGKGGSVH